MSELNIGSIGIINASNVAKPLRVKSKIGDLFIEIDLFCVSQYADGVTKRFRKLGREKAPIYDKLMKEAGDDEAKKDEIEDAHKHLYNRIGAVSRVVDWKLVSDVDNLPPFDTELCWQLFSNNPHWAEDVLIETSAKKLIPA